MRWSSIRWLAQSKLVKSTYVWIFILPIFAKFVVFFEGTRFDSVELPFNWLVFYFSALFFCFGYVTYFLFCPKIVKENEDYSDFCSRKLPSERLNFYLKEVDVKDENISKIRDISNRVKPDNIDSKDVFTLNLGENNCFNIRNYDAKDIFWNIYDIVDLGKKIRLGISLIFYLVGFFLLFVVFVQNFISIISIISSY